MTLYPQPNPNPRPLIECVPNFSEGRNPDTINAIVEAIRQGGSVHVLHVTSDTDHNRTVVTFVGEPSEVERAIFEGIRTAATLIDMDEHRGVHPRFGATDVVPFIPVRDTSMADCVKIAARVGQRVGNELQLPVYLYEYAATRPDRRDLPNLRRPSFQYEQLKTAIHTDVDYLPDFGPAMVGKAGATVIGARDILIAFNVYLNSTDLAIARKIARKIRASSGGLAYVRAIGLNVHGEAQVSFNLLDHRQTALHQVIEQIRAEAQQHGVTLRAGELIGLVPEAVVRATSAWYLQLPELPPERVLEMAIAQAEATLPPLSQEEPPVPEQATRHMPLAQMARPVMPFVEEVAQATPTPGGGATSAVVGALAAALAEMVSGVTLQKRGYEDLQSEMGTIFEQAQRLRERLLDFAARDSQAYQAVLGAYRLPKDDPQRQAQIQEKMLFATEIPLQVCHTALEVLQLTERLAMYGSKTAVADVAVAVHLAHATLESASFNVRVNARELKNAPRPFAEEAQRLRQTAQQLYSHILTIAEKRAEIIS